jgi:hypothetical protein
MNDLRFTDTNAADDSAGRAFGLDGNLYLPVAAAALGAVGLFAGLTFWLHTGSWPGRWRRFHSASPPAGSWA